MSAPGHGEKNSWRAYRVSIASINRIPYLKNRTYWPQSGTSESRQKLKSIDLIDMLSGSLPLAWRPGAHYDSEFVAKAVQERITAVGATTAYISRDNPDNVLPRRAFIRDVWVEACARRIGIHDADLDHDHFSAFHFARVARPYFTGSSLILSPPLATGMTQMGVATSAELSSDI